MSYDYDLPSELIANTPADPRDSARLLVYKTQTGEIIEDVFANIAKHIPEHSLIVLNDTRVIPSRLELIKETGGKVRVLFLVNELEVDKSIIKGLPDRKLKVGDRLFASAQPIVEVVFQKNEEFTFKPLITPVEFRRLIDKIGNTPLPPYIHSDLSEAEARTKYQTIFSKAANHENRAVESAMSAASVAAPTASLHFTEGVFKSLEAKNIKKTFVTLHVGRGTFSPVDVAKLGDAPVLHKEPIFVPKISAETISLAKKEGRPIIASGTTAARVLESTADSVQGFSGSTSIFIRPPYNFKLVDGLITNFHLPNTSLLMLLDALLQSKGSPKTWREIYDYAIEKKFRFYSFGDAMLVI